LNLAAHLILFREIEFGVEIGDDFLLQARFEIGVRVVRRRGGLRGAAAGAVRPASP